MVQKIVSEHVKKTLSSDDHFSRPKSRNEIQDIRREKPGYAGPIYRPLPKLTEIPVNLIPRNPLDLEIDSLEQDINIDFEENSPHLEGVIFEIYQRTDKSYFHEPPELQNQAYTGNVVQQCLLKQANLDKLLKITQRKVLKETHVPVTDKEIMAGYLISPYFKDLFLYLAQK